MHFLTMSHWITMSRARSPPVRIEESVSDNAYTPLRIRRSRYSRVRHRCIWVRHVYLPFSFAMPRAAFSSVGKLPFIHRMHTEKEREYTKVYESALLHTRTHSFSLSLPQIRKQEGTSEEMYTMSSSKCMHIESCA